MQNNNLPDKLELNDWIQLSLDSEDEIFRQIALEELSATGVPPYLSAKIREMSARDESEVCRKLSAWVLGIDDARAELRPIMKRLELSPVNVMMHLENSPPVFSHIFIQLLRKAPDEEILDMWRAGLPGETNPLMVQIGLKILARFGKSADAELGLKFLDSLDSDIVCAALSLIQSQNIELFKTNISKGLKSDSIKIKLHAVHLLRSIDEIEAVKFTSSFLFHRNPLVRQRALRELMLFSFSLVEPIFIRFLSREVQPLLLVKAGFVTSFNPSAELPLKIFEVYQLARGIKKHILQLILKQLVESVKSAGILKQSFEEYMGELKQKIDQKRSELVIRCAVKDLANEDRNLRISAVDRLAAYVEFPSIKNVMSEHLKIENDQEICAVLENLLVPSANFSDEVEEQKFAETSFEDVDRFLALEIKEQKRWLRQIKTDEHWHNNRSFLIKLVKSGLQKNILLEIMKVFEHFGSRIDSPHLMPSLEQKNPSIVSAAIKTIGQIDLDVILPHLNRFLADEDPRIKSAALEIYILADKEGAIQYIDSMLRSASAPTRRIGLSLIPQIDYASAEPLLWNMLKYEANAELRLQAFYMIAANPTQEGIFKLFSITHDKTGEARKGYEEIWELALTSGENYFSTSAREIEEDCWEAFKADQKDEEEQKKKEHQPYAYSSIVGESEGQKSGSKSQDSTLLEIIWEHFYEFRLLYIGGVLAMIPVYFLTSQTGTDMTSKNYKRKVENLTKVNYVKNNSSPSTQVGAEGWQGALRSGAREVLSGEAYKKVLQTSVRECEEIRRNLDRNLQQHYMDLANDQNQPEEMSAWETGNRSEAELYLEKAVKDPQLNTVGKCLVLQKLAEIAEEDQDRKKWIKWHDALFKEMKNMSGYENLKGFDNFSDTFKYLDKVRNYVADGGDKSIIVDHLKAHGGSDESARKSLESLERLDEIFPAKN
jgi:hypothetical protein